MSEEAGVGERKSGYFSSVAVESASEARLLCAEKVWDILHFVHDSPNGIRPKEIAEEFEINPNQAYDKLKQLEEYGFVKRKKERNKPGKKNHDRKTLLYLSGSWGTQELWDDFASLMNEKFGSYVMKEVGQFSLSISKKQ